MKKIVPIIMLLTLLCSFSTAYAATSKQEIYEEAVDLFNNKEYESAEKLFLSLSDYEESEKYLSNIQETKVKTLIAKELYSKAQNSMDSFFMSAKSNGMKFSGNPYAAKYENVCDYTMLDVRYDPNTNRFAAVIELQYTLDSGFHWHNEYNAYTGTFNNPNVIVDTSEILDNNNDIYAFWKNNWEEVNSMTDDTDESDAQLSPENIVEFNIDSIYATMSAFDHAVSGIEKYGYYPNIKVFAIILTNNPSKIVIYNDFPEDKYNDFFNSNNPYSYYWNSIVPVYTGTNYAIP